MERVAIVGSGGAGKTTLARALAAATGLPAVHLDEHQWKPGWVSTPGDEWRELQERLFAGPRWIADGNYGGTLDLRLSRADTVIVLALPRWQCLAGALRRKARNWGRSVQAEGCPERIELGFLRWIWRYPTDGRLKVDAALARHPHLDVVELTSRRAVRRFLRQTGGSIASP